MKFKKVLMIGYQKADLSKSGWNRTDKLTQEKVLLSKDSSDILKHLSMTDCLLVKLGATIDKRMIDEAPNLKYIGMLGTGYGRIDIDYAAKKGITVCNIAGYSTEGVAELAFGLLLEHIRDIARGKLQAKKGDYLEASFQGYELKGKKFGIIGLGRIGGRIAEIANFGFGANVSYWSRSKKKEYDKKGIKYKTIDSSLKESDFISVNLSFVPQTKNFLDKNKIQLIKPGAVVINLAPMELVDIAALAKRLGKKDITFILDHSDELTKEQAEILSKYKNCIMYPPIGYITKEATEAKLSMFVDNLENFLKGKPTNKVN
ncbi:MAG: NAD(P)-dependent oxidoreductase [Candidatus Levybacteria bacterium]|nr:NAD(P)-dependent oxidoreductase [Candidatus Levybacteria bacterium]